MTVDCFAGDPRTNRERMLAGDGAGAVVTRDIPAGVVAAGNPARIIREIGPSDERP